MLLGNVQSYRKLPYSCDYMVCHIDGPNTHGKPEPYRGPYFHKGSAIPGKIGTPGSHSPSNVGPDPGSLFSLERRDLSSHST